MVTAVEDSPPGRIVGLCLQLRVGGKDHLLLGRLPLLRIPQARLQERTGQLV